MASLALVATSDPSPPTYWYRYRSTIRGPDAELTASSPSARFRVTARVQGFAPNGEPTHSSADAFVPGTISWQNVEPGSFVSVRTSSDRGELDYELTAATMFSIVAPLEFEGDCETLSAENPCEASFVVEFARVDGGADGGTLRVIWDATFSSEAPKNDQPDAGPEELPWAVEIVAE